MSGTLSQTDYDRLFEYRLAPSRNDLKRPTRSQKRYKRKGPSAHKDPTANIAIRRVMYTSTSDGY